MADIAELISLELSDDDTVATLIVQPGVTPTDCDNAIVVALLSDEGIKRGTESNDAIDALLAAVAESPDIEHRAVIANGKHPVHGKNGYVVWNELFDPARKNTEQATTDEDESDDSYYVRSAFTMAAVGDHVATIIKPQPGEDGVTVRGKTLAAKTGKPSLIKLDDSVRVRTDGSVIAANAGAVMYDGEHLKIITHLEIDDFVDFSTGNIAFDGDVTVHHGVRDCFVVDATKDIHIHGMVEAAVLIAGRDATLDGGVAGREKGSVKTERDLSARYIDGTSIVTGRHLTVEKEIVNSDLCVGSKLISPNGALIGGTCTVGGECELAELGSGCGAETRMSLGTIGGFEAFTGRLTSLVETVCTLHAKTKASYDQLISNTSTLTPVLAEQVTELELALKNLDDLKSRMEQADERVDRVIDENTDVDLVVHRLIHSGVRLFLGRYEATFKDPIKGPVRITLSAAGRPQITDLISESTTELSEFARVIEIEDETSRAA